MLSPEVQTEILSLHFVQKMKVRAIAKKLTLNRKSVDRVIERHGVAIERSTAIRKSILEPYMEGIKAVLNKDASVPAKVIFQSLRRQEYAGGYTIVKDLVRKLKADLLLTRNKEAFFKIDFPAGACAQVDWGEFGDVFGDGVKIHCFVMVLGYSRLIYVEFTRSERFEDFLRCHENAFRYFGGLVPETVWYDNLPTAVTGRMGRLVQFNARFLAYAGHQHFSPHACNVRRGNEKGRVESGVKLIRSNFWPTREFADFKDLCNQAADWRDNVANYRVHEATKQIPKLVFEAEEKKRLMNCNDEIYETDEVFSKEVRPDFHLVYETNQYSVPWTLVGLVVTVHVDADLLKVFYNGQFITRHERSYLKHQKPFTKPEHEEGLKEIKPQGKNAHINGQIDLLESCGESVKEYLKCLRHNSRSLKTEVSRLLALATIYGKSDLEQAVAEILRLGSIGVERIEKLLKAKNVKVLNPAPLNFKNHLDHVPARMDLRSYDHLLFNKEETKPLEASDDNTTTSGDDPL